jgi:hypothetical protein
MGPSGGPITLDQTGVETYATIFTLAPSPARRHTSSGPAPTTARAHHARRRQELAERHAAGAAGPFTRISLIEASPHAAGHGVPGGQPLPAQRPRAVRLQDVRLRPTWTKIVTGLPADDFARAIREDAQRRPAVLGTEHGIYVSFDDGAHWQSLRLTCRSRRCTASWSKDNDLVIGTHGRSFYVLDNIGVLRQLSAEVTSRRVHLFEPAVATRRLHASAPIDYYLAEAVDRVTIEILDAQGAVVRTFTGTAEDAKRPAPPAGGFGPPPPRVTTSPGMNRFTWDMRYAGPTTFPGMILWAAAPRGPLAAPGTYEVRVTAGDETRTTALTVRRDPRAAGVTDADVAEQFRFAVEIRDRVTEANEAVMRIRHMKAQIADRIEKAGHDRVTSDGQALTARLTEVEGEIYQYRNQSSQDPLNYPIRLNNKIAALQGIVESAEARPTEQSYAVFKELSSRLAVGLSRLDALVQREVAGFNRLVTGRKLEPVQNELPPAEPAPGPGVR